MSRLTARTVATTLPWLVAGFVLGRLLPRSRVGLGLAAAGALLAVVTFSSTRGGGAQWVLAAVIGVALGMAVPARRRRPAVDAGAWRWIGGAVLLVASTGSAAWTGANSPHLGWMGGMISHGPEAGNMVAITFDDGPNLYETIPLRDILDARGAKATFFTVGKALDAAPEISRGLLEHGHTLGNHSYTHDSVRWLDPRYPELAQTQRAFARRLGVCPTFFRPPHGQHTPFMARAVGNQRMLMVGWTVSGSDWATNDAGAVARRVLRGVRPGAIVDLHDGLDGNIAAPRRMLIEALPMILDGLASKGLQAVTLDRLLGVEPYRGRC